MRIMFKVQHKCVAYDDKGNPKDNLPIGLLVEPLSFTTTDVRIVDLTNGVEFLVSMTEFNTKFKPF